MVYENRPPTTSQVVREETTHSRAVYLVIISVSELITVEVGVS